GGAAPLARALGLQGSAWNLESACSSTLLGLQTASALLRTGQHRRALIVTSCTYSRVTVENDPMSWGIGAASSALIVDSEKEGFGGLGSHALHSGDTCGAVAYHLEKDPQGAPYFRMRTGKEAARLLRETAEPYLRACCEGALERAGVAL